MEVLLTMNYASVKIIGEAMNGQTKWYEILYKGSQKPMYLVLT